MRPPQDEADQRGERHKRTGFDHAGRTGRLVPMYALRHDAGAATACSRSRRSRSNQEGRELEPD